MSAQPQFRFKVGHNRRVVDDESDIPEPTAFGQQLACGHMIVSRSSSGKEFVVFVVMDLFSNVFQAFPLSSKDTHSAKEALNQLIGAKALARRPRILKPFASQVAQKTC